MKKILIIFTFLFLILVTTGCGQKPMMDEVNKKGFFPYHNVFFNFDLPLPEEFRGYQTQRVEINNYMAVDFFVPIVDSSFIQEVPGYAEPMSIRVYDKKDYTSLSETDKTGLVKAGENGKKVFVMKFWEKIPLDWKDKWTGEMKQQLVKNFKLK